MEQEHEPTLVLVSNGFLYRHRVDEMGEIAKRQDSGDRTWSMSLLKGIKLHVLLYVFK